MTSKLHISTILFVAAIAWGVLLVVGGTVVSISWLRYFSTVNGAVMLLVAAFDIRLWRLKVLQGWFVKRPDIHGTWRVTIRSNWVDQNTEQRVQPIQGFMAIHQTFSSLSLRLMTDESESELLGGEITSAPDSVFRLVSVYRNEPKLSVRHRSPIHNGALILQVVGRPVTTLKGHYWTDRDSSGELELSDRHERIVHDFEAAKRVFNAGTS